MMNYKYLITSSLVDTGPKVSQRGSRVVGICVSQKPCRSIRKTWERNSKLTTHWFEDNYIKLNTGKCYLLISGHKYEHQWIQTGKDMVWEENIDITNKQE